MPRLLGERIQLREYQADDLKAIRQWVNDEATTRLLSTAYWPPQTLVDTEEFLQRMLQSSHNAFNFVIADRESGRYLGQLDLFTVDWRLRCGKLGGKPGPGPWHGSAAASGKARFPDARTGAAGAGSPHGQRRRPPLLRACRFPAGRREAPRVFRKRSLLRCGDHEHPPGGVRPVTRFSSNAYSTPSLVFRLSPFRGMAFFRLKAASGRQY